MNKTNEKGITLVALVTTIILLLILSTIGVTAGTQTISMANFSQFKQELKIIQTKVNELNEDRQFIIGEELTNEQNNILEIKEISDIIYQGKTEEEKNAIRSGFRYCSKGYLSNNWGLEGIKRDYLINVEYRYVISYNAFKYNEIDYYMVDQLEDEIYNVRYVDKNPKEGDFSFDVDCVKESDRWRIEISNITYTGYISNWQVEYRQDGEEEWKKVNTLNFYVTKVGNYYVRLLHNDIILGPELVSVLEDSINNINTDV